MSNNESTCVWFSSFISRKIEWKRARERGGEWTSHTAAASDEHGEKSRLIEAKANRKWKAAETFSLSAMTNFFLSRCDDDIIRKIPLSLLPPAFQLDSHQRIGTMKDETFFLCCARPTTRLLCSLCRHAMDEYQDLSLKPNTGSTETRSEQHKWMKWNFQLSSKSIFESEFLAPSSFTMEIYPILQCVVYRLPIKFCAMLNQTPSLSVTLKLKFNWTLHSSSLCSFVSHRSSHHTHIPKHPRFLNYFLSCPLAPSLSSWAKCWAAMFAIMTDDRAWCDMWWM